MKRRPLMLMIYTVGLFLMALSIPLQAAFISETSLLEVQIWMRHLTVLNYILLVAFLGSAGLAYTASRKLFYAAPVTIVLVLLNNIWVGAVGLNFSILQTTLASCIFFGFSMILLEENTRKVLVDKRVHWWLSAERRKLSLPISVHPWVGQSLTATTHDLSLTGAYIVCKNDVQYNVGDRMQLRMSIEGYKDVRCTAKLVRKSDGSGSYPAGFGIQFEDLSKYQKQFIENIISIPL